MPSISVSSLDLFRLWRDSEDLDLEWLLRRLRGEEPQTPAMAAGEALHTALETSDVGLVSYLEAGSYKFYIQCDGSVELPIARELKIEKQYGDLLVRGRVDGIIGQTIIDYKSTQNFDADRLLEGYQWRYYLSMTGCDRFVWKIFVLREFFPPTEYEIVKVEELTQFRYPDLETDCERLADDFLSFARALDVQGTDWRRAVLQP